MSLKEAAAAEQADVPAALWLFGKAQFDERKWELRLNGAVIEMEPRPLEILLVLLRHAGETVTRDELLLAVWGHTYLSENTLSNAIAKLRKAIGDHDQSMVVTVHRIGYRLAVPALRRELEEPHKRQPQLAAGDGVPRRHPWELVRQLAPSVNAEIWLARHPDTDELRVFKFSQDGTRLSSLKREATLSRVMQSALGDRIGAIPVLDWNFDQPPFFIECEYGGSSLPDWAEAEGGFGNLSLSLRIELIAQTVEAVAQAHSVGVLHKDLKPSNILIDKDADGRWRVRLTDFGSGGFTDPARLTELASIRMGFTQALAAENEPLSATPLYLAPELLQGQSPTVQTDLYALGVMLYQCVIGDLRRPMAPKWERDVGNELLRQDISDAASGDPEQRLASARELAERLRSLDARRAQAEEAQQLEMRRRNAEKALERSRAVRPWLIALIGSMFVGLTTTLWFYRLSEQSRAETLRQFNTTQAVNDFLDNDLIASANPDVGGSTQITVLDAIRRAANKIDARFAHSPSLAVTLHQTIGNTDRTLGDYASAEAEFRRAKAIADQLPAGNSDVAANSDLLLAQTLAYENRYDEAAALLGKVEDIGRRQPFADPMTDVRLWDVRAMLDRHRTDLRTATIDAERTLAALHKMKLKHPQVYEANAQSVFLMQLHAARDLQDSGRRDEAEKIERPLIDELTQRRGAADPLTIRVRQLLVENLMQNSRLDQAGALLPPLLRDAAASLGGTNRLSLEIQRVAALVYEAQGKLPDAVASSTLAEAGYRKLFGIDNDSTVQMMMDSARISAEANLLPQAIDRYQEAFAAAMRIQGPDGLLTQLVGYGLVDTYLNTGRPDPVRPLLKNLDPDALARAAPDASWDARLTYEKARLERLSGNADAARSLFKTALASVRGDDHVRTKIEEEIASSQ